MVSFCNLLPPFSESCFCIVSSLGVFLFISLMCSQMIKKNVSSMFSVVCSGGLVFVKAVYSAVSPELGVHTDLGPLLHATRAFVPVPVGSCVSV